MSARSEMIKRHEGMSREATPAIALSHQRNFLGYITWV